MFETWLAWWFTATCNMNIYKTNQQFTCCINLMIKVCVKLAATKIKFTSFAGKIWCFTPWKCLHTAAGPTCRHYVKFWYSLYDIIHIISVHWGEMLLHCSSQVIFETTSSWNVLFLNHRSHHRRTEHTLSYRPRRHRGGHQFPARPHRPGSVQRAGWRAVQPA